MRTWSLPLPVQPWAIVSQPVSRAASTASFAISGRPSAVNSGYPPPYSALALIPGST
jgi:hypothetical protein